MNSIHGLLATSSWKLSKNGSIKFIHNVMVLMTGIDIVIDQFGVGNSISVYSDG